MGNLPKDHVAVIPDCITAAPDPPASVGVARSRQNEPNPFSGSTDIRFTLASPGEVTLKIFDVSGRLVRSLRAQSYSARSGVAHWDGKDGEGVSVPSGVYFYELRTRGITARKKMVVIR